MLARVALHQGMRDVAVALADLGLAMVDRDIPGMATWLRQVKSGDMNFFITAVDKKEQLAYQKSWKPSSSADGSDPQTTRQSARFFR